MSEESAAKKKMPCACTILLGILVIVFAWWNVSWGAIALTVLGVLIAVRGAVNQCCCTGASCGNASE